MFLLVESLPLYVQIDLESHSIKLVNSTRGTHLDLAKIQLLVHVFHHINFNQGNDFALTYFTVCSITFCFYVDIGYFP